MKHFQNYEHTQPGTLIRILMMLAIFIVGTGGAAYLMQGIAPAAAVCVGMAVLFVFIFALFHSLTVHVSQSEVSLRFGVGIVTKRFLTEDIESVSAVRSHWYNGWGVRKIMGGWLFNVSGFDAVEIRHANGKRYRIGTDEPKALLSAIQSATAS